MITARRRTQLTWSTYRETCIAILIDFLDILLEWDSQFSCKALIDFTHLIVAAATLYFPAHIETDLLNRADAITLREASKHPSCL